MKLEVWGGLIAVCLALLPVTPTGAFELLSAKLDDSGPQLNLSSLPGKHQVGTIHVVPDWAKPCEGLTQAACMEIVRTKGVVVHAGR